MNNEACSKCGLFDRYVKGKFSYCRPCHTEAQKRYAQRKAQGDTLENLQPPAQPLSKLLNQSGNKLRCPQGHLMRGDNVVESSQRGGRHLRRRCKACERNAKRVTYELQPEPAHIKLSDLLDN